MSEYATTRRVRLNYKFRITGNPLSRIILRFAIAKNIPFQQEVENIQYEHEPEIIFVENNNRFAQLHLKNIKNDITSSISMDLVIKKNDLDELINLNRTDFEIHQEELNRYLIAEKYIEIYKSALIKKADSLTGNNTFDTLKNIYDFVDNHMSFELQIKTYGALYGLKNKIGDCSEYSSLFIALCRINKIPAKWSVGQVIRKNGEVETHSWLEIWFDEHGWVKMDPTRRDFSNLRNYYVKLIDTDYQPKIINSATTYSWNYWGKACKVKLEMSGEWQEEFV